MNVYLVTSGKRGYAVYGYEWNLHSIHLTRESAEQGLAEYQCPRTRPDGSIYHFDGQIEEWPVEGVAAGDVASFLEDDSGSPTFRMPELKQR